jgi:iron complex outermembrane receptor protein
LEDLLIYVRFDQKNGGSYCRWLLAAFLAAASSQLLAQSATEPKPETTPAPAAPNVPAELPEIRVKSSAERETATGPVRGYAATRSASATKTDTPLLETPQAIGIVTRERIADQGATGLQDALNYSAGVRSDSYGLDSRSDGFAIRGTEASVYLDGLRQQLGGFYTSTTRTEPYTLERIEVLRGPSGVLFGQASVGGLVNMVSKRPQAQAQREVGVQFGSFNRRQLQTDLTGPLTDDGQWLYRVVALGRKSDTQVDFVPDDRVVVAPSLTWRPSASIDFTLLALWQRDDSGSTLQFLPWSGTAAPNPNGRIPTNRFVGEPGFDHYDSKRSTIGWSFEHRVSTTLTLRQNLRVSRNTNDYFGSYGDFYSAPELRLDPYVDANQRLLARAYFGGITQQNVTAADQHVEARLNFGGLEHRVLAGLDWLRAEQSGSSIFDFTEAAGGGVPSIDVFAPVYTGYVVGPAFESPRTEQRQVGVYLQDQILFAQRWRAVIGLRRDRAENTGEKSSATTRRLALLYAAPGGWSPYVSYSEAFTPVAGVDRLARAFDPQQGEQIEVGLKFQPDGRGFNTAVALFDLREKNRLVSDPADPNFSIQAGRTRNRGFELEAVGRVTRALELSANYHYLDMTPDSAGNRSYFNALPRHQASLWAKYGFSLAGRTGFSVGLGARAFSGVRDVDAPPTEAFALLDTLLAYDAGDWRAALNVQNLTDKRYFPICLQRGDCFEGARRNVVATLRYAF